MFAKRSLLISSLFLSFLLFNIIVTLKTMTQLQYQFCINRGRRAMLIAALLKHTK